ncbi:hypothetical protein HY837_04055 [archaeon]|nr:hypothetical protein [archaeon]
MKHIYLPNQKKKRRIDVFPEKSPLTLEDKRPLVHNSCIDGHNTVCVHYMVEKDHCKVALYGHKMVKK